MEKLTKQEYIENPSSIKQDDLPDYMVIYRMFAKYEATELTPEEIEELQHTIDTLRRGLNKIARDSVEYEDELNKELENYRATGLTPEEITQMKSLCEKTYDDLRHQLNQYRNTGLAPEEIRDTVKLLDEVTAKYETSVKIHAITTKLLNEYKDAEEQGLLLRLPCKVGDTVYKIIVTGYTGWFNPKKEIISVEFEISMLEQFSKTVFLTREAAEEVLKGSNSLDSK